MFMCSLLLQVPHVNRTDYQLIDISEDGFVCLSPIFFVCFISSTKAVCICSLTA